VAKTPLCHISHSKSTAEVVQYSLV